MKRLFIIILVILLSGCQMKSGEISLVTDDNVKISGDLLVGGGYQPLKNEKPNGEKYDVAVILLHNLGSNKKIYKEFSSFLNSKGFTTLAIDFRGHGGSGGNVGDYSSYLKDVTAAKKFLKEKGYTQIYLVGGSIGANVAVRSAVDNDVQRILLLSPGLNYKGITVLDVVNEYRGELYILSPESNQEEIKFAVTLKDYYLGTKKIRPESMTNEHGDKIVEEKNEDIYATLLWFLTK